MLNSFERISSKLYLTALLRSIEPARSYLNMPKSCYFGYNFDTIPSIKELTHIDIDDHINFKPINCLNRKDFKDLELPRKNENPSCFAIQLINAKVWGKLGCIVSEYGIMISNASHAYGLKGYKHPVWKKMSLRDSRRLDGISLSLAGPALSNYFHWTAQILPKICFIQSYCGINLNDIDHFILSGKQKSFQIEALAMLGIDTSKIVYIDDNQCLQCETLLATNFLMAGSAPWALDWFKKSFQPSIKKGNEKIYISRSDANTRKIINEPELINLLESYGFKILTLEGLSFQDQINCFSSANTIVAPHGAGLTNMIFSSVNTRILELFSSTWIKGSYYLLSNQCNYAYSCIVGHSQNNSPRSDYTINLKYVDDWLNE